MTPTTDAELVRAWRERTGWSQEEAARALGVSGATVSRWEAGIVQPKRRDFLAMARLEDEAQAADRAT